MSNCFSCGRGFKGSAQELLQLYKRDYEERGVERYFYKLEENGDVFVCSKSSFSSIFSTKIKPNFDKGSEYAHIREYGNTKT